MDRIERYVRVYENSNTPVRIIHKNEIILFSLEDLTEVLKNKDKKLVALSVTEVNGYMEMIEWEKDKPKEIFLNIDYSINLGVRSIGKINKQEFTNYIKWLFKTIMKIKEREENENEKFVFSHEPLNESLNKREKLFSTTQIAKMFGMSAKKLNEILHKEKIQYKVNGQNWVLYSTFDDEGLVEYLKIEKPNGEIAIHMYWTEKGVRFIENLLKKLNWNYQLTLDI